MLELTRRTPQTLAVLGALLAAEDGQLYARAVCESTDLPSGTVVPILARLRQAGWLFDRWEDAEMAYGRPPRHYYRLTPEGRRAAEAALALNTKRSRG